MHYTEYKNFLKRLICIIIFSIIIILFYKCPIKAITGYDCPGCGLTRSFVCLIKLDFKKALFYHCLSPLAAIITGYVILHILFPKTVSVGKNIEKIILISFFIMLIIVWVAKHFIKN